MKTPTRRQHYVWRFHLAAWAADGKVAILRRDGGGFHANPANVAAQRDFYRLPRLSKEDLAFIHGFIDHLPQSEESKAFARGWLKAPLAAARARALLASGVLSSQARRDIDVFEIEVDEGWMGSVERMGQPYVERLRGEDARFWPSDRAACIDFSHFLSVQLMRTKRMADLVAAGRLPPGHEGRFERTWPVLKHVFAGNVGSSLFVQRREFTLRTIRARGAARFITSDQPVINLIPGIGDNDLVLYFPVSPTVAALLEHQDAAGCVPGGDDVSDDIVQSLNRRMFTSAHEQVIGADLDALKDMAASPEEPRPAGGADRAS